MSGVRRNRSFEKGAGGHPPVNQDTKMICFPRHVVAVSSRVRFHLVEQCLTGNAEESEWKYFGGRIREAYGDARDYVSRCACKDCG